MPRAASKQAPDIRPCSRSSGLGASPNLPSGSDPITLKYLKDSKIWKKKGFVTSCSVYRKYHMGLKFYCAYYAGNETSCWPSLIQRNIDKDEHNCEQKPKETCN